MVGLRRRRRDAESFAEPLVLEADGVRHRLEAGVTAYLHDGSDVGIRQTGTAPLDLIVAYPRPR